jgi:DNA excision repair protein ERCC-6-like 2
MGSLTEMLKKRKAAAAAMPPQQESGAPSALTNNPPAAVAIHGGGSPPQEAPTTQPSPTQPLTQTGGSLSAHIHVRRRDAIIQQVLSQRKSPPAASPPPVPEFAPLPAATQLTEAEKKERIAAMKIRLHRSKNLAVDRSATQERAATERTIPALTAAAGARASQNSPLKRKKTQSPSSAVKPRNSRDAEEDIDLLDSDEEEEEEDIEEEQENPTQRHKRKQQQQRQPKKTAKSQANFRYADATDNENGPPTVLAAFDEGFATQVQLENTTPAAVAVAAAVAVDDNTSLEEEHQTKPASQTSSDLPPPPSEYRLRLDNQGNELPLNSTEEPYLDLAVPASITKWLRPYQPAGINFLLQNYARGRGCLLADDMGLGKTLQTIAFLAAVLGKSGDPRIDSNHPILPEFQRIPRFEDDPEVNILDDYYEPDYSCGAPILIVCPASLIDNWAAEFKKWGHFRVIKLPSNRIDTGLAAMLKGTIEIGITGYQTLRNNQDKFGKVPWHVCVFDEAHYLKNPKSGQTLAAARLPTRLRFALSGTPMANDYIELFHLIYLVAPGELGTSKFFQEEFAKKIKHGMRSDATEEQIAEGADAQESLQDLLRPLMLRRTKAIIAHQMPKKKDNIVFCQLAPLQMKAYKRALQLPDVQLLLLKAREPCPCGNDPTGKTTVKQCVHPNCPGYYKLTYEQGGVLYPHFHFCECDNKYDPVSNPTGCKHHKPDGCWRMFEGKMRRVCPFCVLMPLLMILRKISLHLDLIKANPEDAKIDPIKYEWDKEVAEAVFGTDSVALGGHIQSSRHIEMTTDISQSCGKLAALKGLLSLWAADVRGSGGLPHKVLIFSNSVRMLKIVRKMADNAGYIYQYLTGETPQSERQKLVDSFNHPSSSAFLFIVSTGAGGVGLNLTAANKVVILDPSYSPASDLQAMDRAFRIGQKRDVDVYRLVAAGTIEERIYMRQISKQQHSNVAVDGAGQQKRLFVS